MLALCFLRMIAAAVGCERDALPVTHLPNTVGAPPHWLHRSDNSGSCESTRIHCSKASS